MKVSISIATIVLFAYAAVAAEAKLRKLHPKHKNCIHKSEMKERIQSFADAVPAISQSYWTNGGGEAGSASMEGCKEAYLNSNAALFGAYAYPKQVNFKPTLTIEPYTYRTEHAGALSYFIGTECLNMAGTPHEQFPSRNNTDGSEFQEYGFALNNANGKQGWVSPTVWDPELFHFHVDKEGGPYCETSMALGQMCFTQGDDGSLVCVDKTFAFNRDADGNVVIVAHHSSKTIEEKSTLICQNNEYGPRCDA